METKLGDKVLIIKSKKMSLPEVRSINCIFDSDFSSRGFLGGRKIKNFWFYLDERDNTLQFKGGMVSAPQIMKDYMEYLIKSFSELKYSDFRYGTIGSDNEIEVEPSINLSGEQFLNYLREKHREEVINNLL